MGWWPARPRPENWRSGLAGRWGAMVRSSPEGLPPTGPGFGPVRQAQELIDSSFFRVYTDPSKPPVIGDLAGFRTRPVLVLLTPLVAGRNLKNLCSGMTVRHAVTPVAVLY